MQLKWKPQPLMILVCSPLVDSTHPLPATSEFIIHSPSTLSQKYWITNSAVHAKWAVVFARLLIGGKDEGIHGFLVRIRNEDMTPTKGVTIEDMGVKMGCNGVDNGKLSFESLRVPRTSLLNAQADVDEKVHLRPSPRSFCKSLPWSLGSLSWNNPKNER